MPQLTKIVLGKQSKVLENVPFNMKNIKDLADPIDDQDAVTKAYLASIVGPIAETPGVIGVAEDGAYTDGLFTDFVPSTPVGTAVDRFNEVLKSLSPQPAPSFSSASWNQTGVAGKLSFGASNVISGYTNVPGIDINGAYARIFNATTAMTGTLANNVTPSYTNSRPYPNYAFGDADQGNLHLVVNGTTVHTVNLTSFTSGASLTNGSGFTLSAATPVAFTNGDLFQVFKYRTGTWTVAVAAQRNGYNTIQLRHEYATGLFRDTTAIDFVVDADTTTTTFSSETLNTLVMTGSRRISGVEFHTAGTAKYGVTINNAFKNTYSASGTAINYSNITDEALPVIVDPLVLSNKTLNIAPTRLLNGSVSNSVSIDRTVQGDLTSTGVSITGLLIENTTDSSTTSSITFNGESRRIRDDLSITSTAYTSSSSPAPWDSAQSLLSNIGLQVYNGQLIYPKTNFSIITNGPAGNVNYSSAAGLRTFIGFFYNAAAYSNFRFNITGTSIAFVSVASGPTGNNLTFEVLAPNTTNGWKDATVPHSGIDSDIGCYASTYGAVIPTAWGCTLGTKNTSTSGNVIVVKFTASAAWTGNISSISVTWL
jgi:hypothetical protein